MKIKNCKNNKGQKLWSKVCKYSGTIASVGMISCRLVSASDVGDLDMSETLGNLNNVIFQIIQLIGIAITAFGVYQLGMSIPSHDSTQRAGGLAAIAGGLIMVLAKSILKLLGVL